MCMWIVAGSEAEVWAGDEVMKHQLMSLWGLPLKPMPLAIRLALPPDPVP